MNSQIVVIPIHKSEPDKWEKKSFEQCCQILGKHTICIVTHCGINLSYYHNVAQNDGITLITEFFNYKYFSSIAGYNLLMLDKAFYKRFAKYQYILIYQLDAWVFRDELDEWCAKGYDYIGAPWIEKDKNGVLSMAGVGNGGFSLRRIQHFIDVLSYKGPVRPANQINLEASLKNNLYKFLYSLGYQNTISYYKKDSTLYEDVFLSIFLSNTKLRAKIPDAKTAARFAFEKHPAFLYSITQKLPFGCHAWLKYEYDLFWNQYISK